MKHSILDAENYTGNSFQEQLTLKNHLKESFHRKKHTLSVTLEESMRLRTRQRKKKNRLIPESLPGQLKEIQTDANE